MSDYKSLSEFICSTREKAGLSIIGLAKKSGLTVEQIEDIEAGKDLFLPATIRQKLAKGLKLNPTDIKKYERILLDAFGMVRDSELKLVLCGSGDAEELVRERVKADERISFLGRVDREIVLALQKNATILVNPRQNNEDFTKYSFPSKNLEYLSSGVPVIAYKLDGIPDEYDEFIIYPENDSVDALHKTIKTLSEMTDEERRCIGDKARCFVAENKNKNTQAQRIFEFIEK